MAKIGSIVNILFDYGTENEKVHTGIILLDKTLVSEGEICIKFDDGDIKFYTRERLEFLVEECQKYEKSKKQRTFKCCPFCGATNINQDGWSEIEKKEFKISGLCVKCQEGFFK